MALLYPTSVQLGLAIYARRLLLSQDVQHARRDLDGRGGRGGGTGSRLPLERMRLDILVRYLRAPFAWRSCRCFLDNLGPFNARLDVLGSERAAFLFGDRIGERRLRS